MSVAEEPVAASSASQPKKRSRLRRWGCGCATFVAIVLAAIPIASVIAYVILRIDDRRSLEKELDLAHAAGYPLTLEEIEADYPTSPQIEAATAEWTKAIETVESDAFKQASVGVPLVQPQLEKLFDPKAPLTEESLAIVRPFVESQQGVLLAARAAREQGAVARFPFEFEKLIHASTKHTQSLRQVANVLRLDLKVRLVDGDWDGAVDDVLSLIATSEGLTNEPNLISQLVRVALIGVATDSLAELLSRGQPTDEGLTRLQEAFARQTPFDGFATAIRGERYLAQHMMRFDSPIDDPRIEQGVVIFPDASCYSALNSFRRIEAAAEQGPASALETVDATIDEIDDFGGDFPRVYRYVNFMFLYPPTLAVCNACIRGDATARMGEAACAVGRYRLANDNPPAALADLVPEYLPAVPIDAYDGAPIRYRVVDAAVAEELLAAETAAWADVPKYSEPSPADRPQLRETGVLFYSVGMDGRDDGGIEYQAIDSVLFIADRESGGDSPEAD